MKLNKIIYSLLIIAFSVSGALAVSFNKTNASPECQIDVTPKVISSNATVTLTWSSPVGATTTKHWLYGIYPDRNGRAVTPTGSISFVATKTTPYTFRFLLDTRTVSCAVKLTVVENYVPNNFVTLYQNIVNETNNIVTMSGKTNLNSIYIVFMDEKYNGSLVFGSIVYNFQGGDVPWKNTIIPNVNNGMWDFYLDNSSYSDGMKLKGKMRMLVYDYSTRDINAIKDYVPVLDTVVEVKSNTVNKSIKVSSPNGGESWELGSTNSITWSPYGYNPDVNPSPDVDAYLEIRNPNDSFTNLGSVIPSGKASIHWTTGFVNNGMQEKLVEPGTNYYIRVVNRKTGEWDRSDRPFTISPKTLDLKVNKSDGPIKIKSRNEMMNLSWKVSSKFKDCVIYGLDGVSYPVKNTGTKRMSANMLNVDQAYLTLNCSPVQPIINDPSPIYGINYLGRVDHVQVVLASSYMPPASLNIISPNGGETIVANDASRINIAWRMESVSTPVSIALYKDDKWLMWIEKDLHLDKSIDGTYSYLWTPGAKGPMPPNLNAGNNPGYKIYITGKKADGMGYIDDKSDSTFSFTTSNNLLPLVISYQNTVKFITAGVNQEQAQRICNSFFFPFTCRWGTVSMNPQGYPDGDGRNTITISQPGIGSTTNINNGTLTFSFKDSSMINSRGQYAIIYNKYNANGNLEGAYSFVQEFVSDINGNVVNGSIQVNPNTLPPGAYYLTMINLKNGNIGSHSAYSWITYSNTEPNMSSPIVKTDKDAYNIGDIMNVTIQNLNTIPMFPDSKICLNLNNIENNTNGPFLTQNENFGDQCLLINGRAKISLQEVVRSDLNLSKPQTKFRLYLFGINYNLSGENYSNEFVINNSTNQTLGNLYFNNVGPYSYPNYNNVTVLVAQKICQAVLLDGGVHNGTCKWNNITIAPQVVSIGTTTPILINPAINSNTTFVRGQQNLIKFTDPTNTTKQLNYRAVVYVVDGQGPYLKAIYMPTTNRITRDGNGIITMQWDGKSINVLRKGIVTTSSLPNDVDKFYLGVINMQNGFYTHTSSYVYLNSSNQSAITPTSTGTVLGASTYCPQLTKNFERGATDAGTGGEVSNLQRFLANYFGLDENESVTGFFGNMTINNLVKFQYEMGLKSTGYLGDLTREKIREICLQ